MSRAESQERTRSLLLDSAERVFATEGFDGASLDRIAANAGFTRGAIYSNFVNKADLFVKVLDRRLERRRDEIREILSESGTTDAFLEVLRSRQLSPAQSDETMIWFKLRAEFRLHALRSTAAAEQLAVHERQEREAYARAAEHLLGQMGVPMPAAPKLVAAILLALDESLSRQHLTDPEDVPETSYADAVALLLEAARALAGQRRDP